MWFSNVESMKENFAKLLLGTDASGGREGVTTALALSQAITNLAVSTFGELWRLEPLCDEKRNGWQREMEWLLSPTNYMIELVPQKQSGTNGCTLEIMTPRCRLDVQINLPALRKLDSILIEVLDSMVDREFWYCEGDDTSEARRRERITRERKRWWHPSPRVPDSGLSIHERRKLESQGQLVRQVLKAAKSINEHVLLQMPVPATIRNALPKSGKANLSEEMYKIISLESNTIEEKLSMLKLRSEHTILETINRLEAAIYIWKEKLSDATLKRSSVKRSLAFLRDARLKMDKIEVTLEKAETVLTVLKLKFPNLPQSFFDVNKVQYNKDIGHSIVEAYSRVMGNSAFSILSRIGDILQEDDLRKPRTPLDAHSFDFYSHAYRKGHARITPARVHVKLSLIEQLSLVDESDSDADNNL